MTRFGVDVYDVCAALGWLAIEYGVSRWSVPAAWILAGLGLLGLGVWPQVRKMKR